MVDAERTYKQGRSSTLQDSLGLATGVFVQPRFGSEESRLSIRGSGIQRTYHQRGILLMQDGVPINLADGSGDFQAIEPLALDHIQVYRGANAWQYGVANLGGAINFITPSVHDMAPVDLRAESGSFGYRRLFAGAAHDFGSIDGTVSASDYRQDGFREHSRQENQRYFANLGGRLNERLSTRFYFSNINSNSDLPGNLSKAQLRSDPTQAAAGNVSGDQQRNLTLNRVGNLTTLQLNDEHSVELTSFYSDKYLDHPIFQVLDVHNEDYGLRLTHHYRSHNGYRLSSGIEQSHGRAWDSRYVNSAGNKGRKVNELHNTARNSNVFSQLEVPLNQRWAAIVGGAWLHSDRQIDDRLRCNAFVSSFCLKQDESIEQSFTGRVGRLGLRYDHAPGIQFYGNVSQSHEPPTLGEMAGAQIINKNDAQTANTLELGLRWSYDRLDVDLALYRSEIRDELLQLNDSNGNALGTINADRTLHQGIELGGALAFGQFVARGQYLYNDFRFDNDTTYGNNPLAGIPSQFLKGELLWQQGGWYMGPTAEWVPTHYSVDHADTLHAEGYAIWGAKLGFRQQQGVGFFVEGRNLSDKTYIATTGVVADAKGQDQAQFLPGDGRAVYAGVEWRL
nr:TonB-dependent receptor [Atopomonas sediminilitoris]